ncbi:hypothetical protein EYC84_002738 [Monilinia fructicola]|uniref:Uncharacterized protein n=1 Tax=Monilinia fructicola TaxID=38448 RepID=A0A5M9JP25_MONFR|nr:hypothetical protein EYC84_002738 [Monilinia fructicola]
MGGAKERRGERDEKVCIIDAVQYNTTIQIHGLMQTWSYGIQNEQAPFRCDATPYQISIPIPNIATPNAKQASS